VGSFDILHSVKKLVCTGIQNLEFVVFFRGEKETMSLDVECKMVKISILESGKWNGRNEFQGRLVSSFQSDRKNNEYSGNREKNDLHAFLLEWVKGCTFSRKRHS
jgi:hypothetical protein